jgi:hypothetical protein
MRLFLATLSFLWSYGAADYTDCDVASCSCLGISLSVLKSTGGAQTLFQEGGGDDPSSFLLSLCDPMSAADLAGCQNTSVSTSFLRKANPKATGKPKCTYLGDTDSMQAEYAVSAEGVPALQVQYSHLNGTGSGDAGLSRVVITFTESPPNATQGPSNVTQVNDTYYTLEWRGLPNAPVAPTPPPPAPVHGCAIELRTAPSSCTFVCCPWVGCMPVATAADRQPPGACRVRALAGTTASILSANTPARKPTTPLATGHTPQTAAV